MPSKVPLEELLRLKRSERPAPEFWPEFERALRQRQLAALVEKRSWWHNLAAAYGRLGRLALPLGAATLLAVTFLSSRNRFWIQRDVSATAAAGISRRTAPSVPSSLAGARAPDERSSVVALSRPQPAEAPASTTGEKSPTVVATTAVGDSHPAVTPVSWLEDVLADRGNRTDAAPTTRSIAVDLATIAPFQPDLVDSVARPLGFEERAMPMTHSQHSAEMLPTAAAVTEPRRTRLLASLGAADVYAPGPSAPEHARRSVLRYLAEDGWDRSMSRLEAEGDKLSIKF